MMNKILILFVLILFITGCETQTTTTSPSLRGVTRIKPTTPVPSSVSQHALVIGNSRYDYSQLRNTVNDATDIAQVLRTMDFQVTFKTNLNQRDMDNDIRDFGRRLSENQGVGLFYYSGHGARANGENYLIPIDNNRIGDERDLPYYAISANKILKTMQDARNHVNIIVLDACRDNPYKGIGKSANRGLARMESPSGSIIAFATTAGKIASDVSQNNRNGLYTSHLIGALKKAKQTNQRIDDMFMAVNEAVTRESGGAQEPWQQDSLKRPFCFGGCQEAKENAEIVRLRREKKDAERRAARLAAEIKAKENDQESIHVQQDFTMVVTQTRSRALLVGIDEYEAGYGAQSRGSKEDVRNMQRFIQKVWGYKNSEIKVLVDSKATKKAILRAFDNWLINGTRPGDRVFFYFGGHGHRILDKSGDEDDGYDETIIPVDGIQDHDSSIILDDDIAVRLKHLRGREVMMIVDSAFSGTITDGLARKKPNMLTYSASAANQVAFEDVENPDGGGVFTHIFLKGVEKQLADANHDGRITHAELLKYLQRESQAYCDRTKQCGAIPQLEIKPEKLGEDILTW